jgi:hypothetical protein
MLRSCIVALSGVLLSVPAAGLAQENARTLPLVGTKVRVMAPALGSGWHYGEFNRLRVEPPCYRVLIFSTGATSRIEHTLSVREFVRIQIAEGNGDGQARSFSAIADQDRDSNWRELSVELLLEAEKACGFRQSP